MIYTIPEEEEPINSCTSESESTFNPNLNSDNNDDENNGSSSAQYGNKNNNDLDPNLKPKAFIALFDLTKEQEPKWFSDNSKDIMPERTHDTDARFDLRYLGKNAIKLEPHLHTYIDLKIALEISATTMVQLASRSSLAKKGINIRERIIDIRYVGNIIPNEKIAQAIFLPLVKVAQLILVGNRKKLGITAREIQGFGSMGRIDIPYMLALKRKVKNQAQLFKAEATICESGEIGLTNLYILVKSPKNIKIPIYNTMESVIKIPKGIIIGYLTIEVKDQPLNHIPDFLQLCGYVDIISQTIYG
ncbi:hypothetical protein G9A89_013478 [Geosiphon pyriformis]|nr:hypothetical protein G9A89_013478 [Geosiphon pyriformis]